MRRHGGKARGGGARSSIGAGLDGASTMPERSLGDAGARAGCGGGGAAERCAREATAWSCGERGLKLWLARAKAAVAQDGDDGD